MNSTVQLLSASTYVREKMFPHMQATSPTTVEELAAWQLPPQINMEDMVMLMVLRPTASLTDLRRTVQQIILSGFSCSVTFAYSKITFDVETNLMHAVLYSWCAKTAVCMSLLETAVSDIVMQVLNSFVVNGNCVLG